MPVVVNTAPAPDGRIDLMRHPLRGVPATATEPPPSWTPYLRATLQAPRHRALVTTQDVQHLVERTWTSLHQLVNLEGKDMADLHPYRVRAGWRLVRARLLEDGTLQAHQSLSELDPRKLLSSMPPPVTYPLAEDYDPKQDELLVAFCNRASDLALNRYMDQGTKEDPTYGQYQLGGMLNPNFARAAWPTVFELHITEAAMVEELVREVGSIGMMEIKGYLINKHGILGQEADEMVAFALGQMETAYGLSEEQMRALFLSRFDDSVRRARDEYDLRGELTALKAAAVIAGLGRAQADIGLGDIIDAMAKSIDIDNADGSDLMPDRDQDPLLLEDT